MITETGKIYTSSTHMYIWSLTYLAWYRHFNKNKLVELSLFYGTKPPLLLKWCGHTSVVQMMWSYKCYPNDAVIQVLSKWCGHTSVVQMMRSYKCCPNDAVIQVLSKWCGHKSVVQMMRSYRCCPNVSKLSTLTYKDGLLQLLFSQLNVKHRRYQSVNNIYKIHYNLA